ncbi:MAG: hypothetical protein GY730_05800 [bacterium]|nr:hypothetical protein [bacterium]
MIEIYFNLINPASIAALIVIATYCYVNRKNNPAIISLMILCVVFIIWQIDLFGLRAMKNVNAIYKWRRLPRIATMLLAPFYLSFVYSFMRKKKDLLIILCFVIGGLFACFRFVFFTFDKYKWNTYYWVQLKDFPTIAWFFFTFTIFFYALFLLYKFYISSTSYKDTQQAKYLLIALGGFVFFNLDFLRIIFRIDTYFIGNMATILFTFVTAYAITKSNLLDITIIITKGNLLNITIIITSAGSYALIFLAFILSFSIAYFYSPYPLASILTLGFIWLLFGEKLRSKLQTKAEQKWITDWYDPVKFSQNISGILAPILDRRQLCISIANEIKKTMQLTEVHIFTASKDIVSGLHHYRLLGGALLNVDRFDADNIFVEFISNQTSPIIIGELEKKQKNKFIDMGISSKSVCLPIYSNKMLEGFLICDQKITESPYNKNDISIFSNIINQTHIAVDRIEKHERLQIEHMKSMEIAEEATSHKNFVDMSKQIAHEINNPMCVIRMGAKHLIRYLKDQTIEKKDLIMTIIDQILDEAELTRKTAEAIMQLQFTESKHKVPLSINTILDDVSKMPAPPGIFLDKKELGKNLPNINADKYRLNRVFVNLINNGYDAIKMKKNGGGELIIKSYLDKYEDPKENIYFDAVRIDVIDNGIGMTNEQLLRVFDPYYTTKADGHGIGMITVRDIIFDHGGRVLLQSKQNTGTTVSVFLPYLNPKDSQT